MDGEWRTIRGVRVCITKSGQIIKGPSKLVGTSLQQRLKAQFNKEYKIPEEELDQIIKNSVSETNENEAKCFIAKMTPDEYLKLTAYKELMDEMDANNFKLDQTKMAKDYIRLTIKMDTKEIIDHQGRHRTHALKKARYKTMNVIVYPDVYGKTITEDISNVKLQPQFPEQGTNKNVIISKMYAVNKKNEKLIREMNK